MKKIYILLLAVITTLSACKKNTELIYPQNRQSINIWLANGTTVLDSLTHNFAYTVSGRDSILFNYRLLGYPRNHDIEFELEAYGGDQDLIYYDFGKYVIKAGQYEGKLPLYIDKPEQYNEFINRTGNIIFRLKESGTVIRGAAELSSLNILFKNFVAKPDNWDAATTPYRSLSYYFGAYSDVKYGFMIQTIGMSNFYIYIISSRNPNPDDPNTISSVTAAYYKNMCIQALLEYEASNGILYDENGTRVTF